MDLLKKLFERRGIIEFAAAWTALGIFGYVKIQQWQKWYKADLAAIHRGHAKAIELEVTDKVRSRTANDVDYAIYLGNGSDPRVKHVDLPQDAWEAIKIGDVYRGYRVNGRVRVYAFDRGNFHLGKWAALGILIIPGTACLAFVLLSAVHACHRDRLKPNANCGVSTPQRCRHRNS